MGATRREDSHPGRGPSASRRRSSAPPAGRRRSSRTVTSSLRIVRAALHNTGLLLAADRDFPNVFTLVTGRTPVGSWWGDPDSEVVYAVLRRMERGRTVLRLRLLAGKWTYIDRSLWPAVLRVVERRRAWQEAGLSPLARRMLQRVNRIGVLDLQDPASRGGATLGSAGDAARELERRLLVVSHEVHTPMGLHTKTLESWTSWKRRHRAQPGRMREAQARDIIERVVAELAPGSRLVGNLPWMPRGAMDPKSGPRRMVGR